jgi:intein/homing endonuclease
MQFPNIPNEFLRHFVRGLFDGDGSLYIERKSIRVKLLSGCRKFVEELNSFMRLNGLSNRKIDYSHTIESPGAFFIRYNSVSDIILFHQFIYHGVSITNYYSMKKDIFDQHFNKCLIK